MNYSTVNPDEDAETVSERLCDMIASEDDLAVVEDPEENVRGGWAFRFSADGGKSTFEVHVLQVGVDT